MEVKISAAALRRPDSSQVANMSPANMNAADIGSARPLMYATASVWRGCTAKMTGTARRTTREASSLVSNANSSTDAARCQRMFVT